LLIALFLLASAPASPSWLFAQASTERSDQLRLDSLLPERAASVLARYNDTFYVLGLAVSQEGRLIGLATRHWPSLDATPDEWRDSLLVAMHEILPRLRAAAYLSDRWRQSDSRRADSTFAVFHFETPSGVCVETRRQYRLTSSGRPEWAPPVRLACRHEIWVPAVPRAR